MSFKWRNVPRPILESLIRKTSSGAYGLECSKAECAPLIEAGCIYEGGTIYLDRFYTQMKQLEKLAQERSSLKAVEIPRSEEADPRLNEEQKKAVEAIFKTPTLLLQGGPGSGKTFTISCMIPLFVASFEPIFQRKPRILLAAQTAKAVHHLAKQIPKGAMDQIDVETLHRVLRISKGLKAPLKTVVDHDLIIVDESSMIDGDMMNLFLKSLKPTSRVIFLGDPRQLPRSKGVHRLNGCFKASFSQPIFYLDRCVQKIKSSSTKQTDCLMGLCLQHALWTYFNWRKSYPVSINPLT